MVKSRSVKRNPKNARGMPPPPPPPPSPPSPFPSRARLIFALLVLIRPESLAQANKEWVTCAKPSKAQGTRLRNVAYLNVDETANFV